MRINTYVRSGDVKTGSFGLDNSHSPVVLLLDKQGVVRARTSNLAEPDADFMRALNQELK